MTTDEGNPRDDWRVRAFIDPYLDPVWGILKNRVHARTADELDRYEADHFSAAFMELSMAPVRGSFDLAHLREIHRRLFHEVYDWAGQLRTIDMHKADDPEGSFHPHARLEQGAQFVFGNLAAERHLRGLDQEQFVERLAHYLDEVNTLHPFREGNGRAQRLFFSTLADRADYAIRWRDLDAERNISASRAAHHGDRAPLQEMLNDLVDPLEKRGSRRADPPTVTPDLQLLAQQSRERHEEMQRGAAQPDPDRPSIAPDGIEAELAAGEPDAAPSRGTEMEPE